MSSRSRVATRRRPRDCRARRRRRRTLGLKAISDRGGLTFAQSAESAEFDSMPRNAALTGVADHVSDPAGIAGELLQYDQHMRQVGITSIHAEMDQRIEDHIPAICRRLLEVTEHDFRHYKTSTLVRRIHRRMQVLKESDVDQYQATLRRNDDEVRTLFRELLIGVTEFFRDPEAFETLQRDVLASLFRNRDPSDPIRIWVPGCATGQEAYSIAMLCLEQADRRGNGPAVQVFATDIDRRASRVARSGTYVASTEGQIGPERLRRFFVRRGKRLQVTKALREVVHFSPHNLISDPPFSRLDLISCRNLLIYLGAHLQEKLIPVFHYALRPSGFLFLGPSETVSSHQELFRQVAPKFRISQRKATAVETRKPAGGFAAGQRPTSPPLRSHRRSSHRSRS